jgi:hypothetical protein
MRTLLRKKSTGLYFQGPDRWTYDPSEAHNFKLIDRALQFIEQWQLKDVELAFSFERGKHVTGVPFDRVSLKYSD